MKWYSVNYRLNGAKEIMTFMAESTEAATQYVTDYYTVHHKGIYGIPVVEAVCAYADFEAVKEAVMRRCER